MSDYVEVVAAVIRRQDGDILLAQRGDHQHQGGKWEFPGGKVEPGENRLRALSRELQEELGIVGNLAQPLMTIEHQYADKAVRLYFYEVQLQLPNVTAQEGQPLAWVKPEALHQYEFPAANKPLVNALSLGSRLLIWPDEAPSNWEIRLHLALQRGIDIFYARNVTDETLLAQQRVICHQHQAKLLVTDDLDLMQRVGADGVHLRASTARALQGVCPRPGWLSVACHNADELKQAKALGADMVLLSPINQTESHPDDVALGWEAAEKLARGRSLVVYALGGVGPADLTQARAYGLWGVAGISHFWPPAQLLHEYIANHH